MKGAKNDEEVFTLGGGRQFNLLLGTAYWKADAVCVGVIQSRRTRAATWITDREVRIYEPWELKDISYDAIIISNASYKQVLKTAEDESLSLDKIILPYMTGRKRKYDLVMQLSEYIDNAEVVIDVLTCDCFGGLAHQMRYDITEDTLYNNIEFVKDNQFMFDINGFSEYGRIRTLELLIRELKEKNIGGQMAEVGVFNGRFSKIMSHYFPEKELYLYDTFGGFDLRDSDEELKQGNITQGFSGSFKNTSVEKVRKYIGNEKHSHFRIGYFPETIMEVEKGESFCLVSLDADLYNPILAGLEFFYPRLSSGGYILIHEYNVRIPEGKEIMNFAGVKNAVRDFESKHGRVNCVPICDRNGTLVITK